MPFFSGESRTITWCTLPETNSKRPLKRDGWNTYSFPIGEAGLFSGAFAVSFREGNRFFFMRSIPTIQPLEVKPTIKRIVL